MTTTKDGQPHPRFVCLLELLEKVYFSVLGKVIHFHNKFVQKKICDLDLLMYLADEFFTWTRQLWK